MAEDCIFCKIAKGEFNTPAVYQDDELFAFRDINPVAPTHILIITRKHIVSTAALEQEAVGLMGRMILAAAQIARIENVETSGYRLVMNTGADGGQTVFHLHIHLLAGRKMTWPPG